MSQECADVPQRTIESRETQRSNRHDVTGARLSQIHSLIDDRELAEPNAEKLCNVATDLLGLSGASIMLRCSRTQFTSVCASNPVASKLLDLELTCGEGPAREACVSLQLVEEPLLATRGARWIMYGPQAVKAGARAVFSFPILNGVVPYGALNLYRDFPGSLSLSQTSDGYLLAAVVGESVLALQAGSTLGTFGETLQRELSLDFAVHQATGMIAVQASMNVADAFVVLKFHAFATDSTIVELAHDVVARRVFFDKEEYALCTRP